MNSKGIIIAAAVAALSAPAIAAAQDHVDRRVVFKRTEKQTEQRPRPRVPVQPRDQRDAREEAQETLKRTVRLGANGELEINNVSGNIEIKRGGGSEATIDIVKIARARTQEEAKELLPLVKVEVAERGSRVEVRTMYPQDHHVLHGRRNMNVHVHYTITAPAGTRVSARTIGGHIRVADIAGQLVLESTAGDVNIVRGRRIMEAKSTAGTVSISDSDSEVPLEATSVAGSVQLQRVKAPRIEVNTVAGKVTMQDVASDNIEAASVAGDIEFGGPIKKGGRYELNSHAGTVKVWVESGSNFQIEANSWSGSIQSEVEVKGAGVQTASGRGPRRKELQGVVGNGGATLEITTFSGSVILAKR